MWEVVWLIAAKLHSHPRTELRPSPLYTPRLVFENYPPDWFMVTSNPLLSPNDPNAWFVIPNHWFVS